jgi:uncharacterized protein YndB with AHSA1/START domain
MQKHQFTIRIAAPREKIWEVLWNKDTYQKWTSAFMEGSTVETDSWKKGSKVRFVDAKGSGMVAMIAENVPNEFMSFKHLGEVKNGVEDTTSDKVSSWAGAMEEYSLKKDGDETELVIEMDITPEFSDYFLKTWPKALENVKRLSEQ